MDSDYMDAYEKKLKQVKQETKEEKQDKIREHYYIDYCNQCRAGLGLSKRSIQTYFRALTEAGLLKVVDRKGRTLIYATVDSVINRKGKEVFDIDETTLQAIGLELGDEVQELIEKDSIIDDLDVKNQDDTIIEPGWSVFDND